MFHAQVKQLNTEQTRSRCLLPQLMCSSAGLSFVSCYSFKEVFVNKQFWSELTGGELRVQ